MFVFFNNLVLQLRKKKEIWSSQLIQSHEDKKTHKTICPQTLQTLHKASVKLLSCFIFFPVIYSQKAISFSISTEVRLGQTWKTLDPHPFYQLDVLLGELVDWTILNCQR